MIGKQKKVVIAGAIGNVLEWYDFTIYAFFVPVIATQFFPNKDPVMSLMVTLGVFALGFIVRPLGAILFGYIGDQGGRKQALILSMIMMSLPTFLIGVLPNYETIGLSAPLLLIGLRLIQGLAVSGELTTATVFLTEHADKNRRGIAGSLAMSGAHAGMVISSLFASLLSMAMSSDNLHLWGWRIPFLLGGAIGIFGLIIRLKTVEPTIYKAQTQSKAEKKPSVITHIISLCYRKLILGVFLTSIMACANYFLIAFFNTFLIEVQKMPTSEVMLMSSIALTTQMLVTIGMGRLSDLVGRKPILGCGIMGLVITIYPIFWLLTQQQIFLAFMAEIIFAIGAGTIAGVIPVTLSELFDTYHRNMGISISYNLSLAAFGGTAPLIAMALVKMTGNVYAPIWYLMACAGAAMVSWSFLKESYHAKL